MVQASRLRPPGRRDACTARKTDFDLGKMVQRYVRSFRRVVFARTCSKLGSVESLFYPSNGWFCQNLPEIRSAKSLLDPSDGWFCPNLLEIRSAKSI